ncbi:hypothetical protein [Pseudomonas borbori]|uniref:DnrO protein n=1 Tax=Pseudomonas borbori TaxID=289003 RepID=A0A1I5UYP9_9PSED|nr:hypothetical protein [Pseudomonas borbori]SFQ00350.1 hypothetical protein SAMN05216190_1285 [Pseudomonas borbori]
MYPNPRAVILALILGATSLSFAGVSLAGETAHQHGAAEHELQLNAGEKWATDAPLRKAMGALNGAMQASLPAIHDHQLDDAQYEQLAVRINDEVAYMVKHCKLEPEADAQLHLIIAELLAGADSMAGKTPDQARRNGAVKVLGALQSYAEYFADSSFETIQH